MDFFQNATDDQIALMGCFAALISSAALMYLSVFLSRTHRKKQLRRDVGHTLSLSADNQRLAQKTDVEPRKVA